PLLPQLLPHAPQFVKLFIRSRHTCCPLIAHEVNPGLQEHAALPAQNLLLAPARAEPHRPQSNASIGGAARTFPPCFAAQLQAPQLVCPATAHVHWPDTQIWPCPPTVPGPPQAPQWAGSVVVSMHPAFAPQWIWAPAQLQTPDVQAAPGPHLLLQAPQLLGSV